MTGLGTLVDRLGPRPVMVACSFGISLIPVIWLFPTPACLWPLAMDSTRDVLMVMRAAPARSRAVLSSGRGAE